MRRSGSLLLTIIAAVFLLVSAPFPARAYEYSYARIVRISYVHGDAQVSRPDQQNWEKAFLNLPIQQGYTIATTDGGRVEIEFESGATARVAENSILQFTELALFEGGRITKLTLTQGTGTFYANPSSRDTYLVVTPQLQVTAHDKAEFRLDVFNDGSSVSVFRGDVTVDSAAGSERITKGQTLAYSAAQPDTLRVEANPSADEWDRWVSSRDDSTSGQREQVLQYTRAPFSYGLADLSNYGAWYDVPGYGYGWAPWGTAAGWMPFWDGRWLFYPGLGWTWISNEPWGWVPYHFGRWVWTPVYGWVWLPGYYNYWCPANVYWVRVGNRLGWAPLPPNTPVGATPSTPPQGPIVVNTPTGVSGGQPNQVLHPNPNLHVRVLTTPPRLLDNGAEGVGRGVADWTGAMGKAAVSGAPKTKLPVGASPFSSGATVLVPTTPQPAGPSEETLGIVFDPGTHTFLNNPVPEKIPRPAAPAKPPTPPAPQAPPAVHSSQPVPPAVTPTPPTKTQSPTTVRPPVMPPLRRNPDVSRPPEQMKLPSPAKPPASPAAPAPPKPDVPTKSNGAPVPTPRAPKPPHPSFVHPPTHINSPRPVHFDHDARTPIPFRSFSSVHGISPPPALHSPGGRR